ncbi:MAG: glycosyltransferase family 2 protein [Ferruginibacter sp.]
MSEISVVIITKNEAENIVACITSAKKLSNDIIVVDSGSEDDTVALAEKNGAKVRSIAWSGYGNARNKGAALAVNDWIISLDADERITDELAVDIAAIDPGKTNHIYGFRRINFFRNQQIKHGSLGHERVFRFYNRRFTKWNNEPVHEKLIIKSGVQKILKQSILHYGIRDLVHYEQKKMNYAYLCAIKYLNHGKKSPAFFRMVSPSFHFLQSFIFRLGFLDGQAGFITARINANYTWKKYDYLYQMMRNESRKDMPAPGIGTSSPPVFADAVHAD